MRVRLRMQINRIGVREGGNFGFWICILFVSIPEGVQRDDFLRDGANERKRDIEFGEEGYRILLRFLFGCSRR